MDKQLVLHLQARLRGKVPIDHEITSIGISQIQITVHFGNCADVVVPIWYKYQEDVLALFYEIYDTYGCEISDAIVVKDVRGDDLRLRHLSDMYHELLSSKGA